MLAGTRRSGHAITRPAAAAPSVMALHPNGHNSVERPAKSAPYRYRDGNSSRDAQAKLLCETLCALGVTLCSLACFAATAPVDSFIVGCRLTLAQRIADCQAQRRQHVFREPGIAPLPRRGAPGRMRQREIARQMRPEIAHLLGHRAAPQHVRQRVPADQQRQADLPASAPSNLSRHSGAHSGRGGASPPFGRRPRIAKSHRHDGDAAFVVERVAVHLAATARNRSPDGSFHGMPVSCTLVPGAWPMISSRAVCETRNTGRGPTADARHRRGRRALRRRVRSTLVT